MDTKEMLKVAEETAKSIEKVRRTLDPLNAVPPKKEGENMFNNPLLNMKPPTAGRKNKVSANEGNLVAENIVLKKQIEDSNDKIEKAQQQIADLYAIIEKSKDEFLTNAENFYADQFLKLQHKVWEAISSEEKK